MLESSPPAWIASRSFGPELSPFVSCFWSCEAYAAPHARERLLPTGSMGLFFTLDAEGRVAAGVSGAYSEAVMLDTSRPFSIIGVAFKAGGGFPFFGCPSDELHNCSASLDEVWGADGASLRDRLWEATTPQQRFRTIQNALLASRRDRLTPHRAVRYALEAFDTTTAPLGSTTSWEHRDLIARFADSFDRRSACRKGFCRIRRSTKC